MVINFYPTPSARQTHATARLCGEGTTLWAGRYAVYVIISVREFNSNFF
jgi:hypothetical protein